MTLDCQFYFHLRFATVKTCDGAATGAMQLPWVPCKAFWTDRELDIFNAV